MSLFSDSCPSPGTFCCIGAVDATTLHRIPLSLPQLIQELSLRGELAAAVLSTFTLDLPWFLSACPAIDELGIPTMVVHGDKGVRVAETRSGKRILECGRGVGPRSTGSRACCARWAVPEPQSIETVHVPCAGGVFHSKFALLFVGSGVWVAVSTANLVRPTAIDGLWMQHFPLAGEAAGGGAGGEFGPALQRYLLAIEGRVGDDVRASPAQPSDHRLADTPSTAPLPLSAPQRRGGAAPHWSAICVQGSPRPARQHHPRHSPRPVVPAAWLLAGATRQHRGRWREHG